MANDPHLLADPVELYAAGYHDLISVIPPGAQLTPTSKIDPTAVGKVPGRRLATGMWAGYDWRRTDATLDDVRRWVVQGANIGLRTDRFPAIDIDCTDETLATMIERTAERHFGRAPRRIGRAPKRLLLFRTDEPFSRMRLWFKRIGESEQHLIEVLGQGQQFVLAGIHPKTERAYVWLDAVPAAAELPLLTRDAAAAFLAELEELFSISGITAEREGDGRPQTRVGQDAEALVAPSIELLRECVELIPNDNDLFPSRTDYLTLGYAIRAAAGGNEGEGLELYQEWAAKWEGNDRSAGNEADIVAADWERFRPPYSVGWGWLCEQARPFGFNDAALEFAIEAERPTPDDALPAAPKYSDQWLAEEVVRRERGRLRYVPQKGCYLVWHAGKWEIDAELLAEDVIKQSLRRIAGQVARQGATDKEKHDALEKAQWIASAARANAVAQFIRSDRAVAVSLLALDSDPWVLNTPAGLVDLRTGAVQPADPDALCTRSTTVAPDASGACPTWRRFLAEATGGDAELVAYLQRLAGYCLTGRTEEQQLTFVWGPGGNGKSVFLNVLSGVLGDYARTASMDTFTASGSERHSTDIAMLAGARLVTASETQVGKRWDEARIKSLTGGEPVSARFMRQDFFTYRPQLKLVFVGNHKPEIRDIDDAMKRRVQMVPFTHKPARVDPLLGEKLEAEWPAILAWMIAGCLAWQAQRLAPPAIVQRTSEEYFEGEDAVGRWMKECLVPDAEGHALSTELFESWTGWAHDNGEYIGSMKRLISALQTRDLARWRDNATRRMGFQGIRINWHNGVDNAA